MDIRDPPVPFVIYRARNPRRSNMFTKTGARSQRSASQPIYNPYKSTNGTAARHPYFSISIDSINATIKDMCDPIAKALESSQPKISPDPKLVEYLLKCQSGPLMKVTVVVFTGTQGIGKSTLINAVLGVEIADVSGGTHACTQYGSRYVCKHTQGDSPDLVDVVLEFLSVENLTDVIDEFARRYLDYHYPTKEEDESPGGDDQCKSETEKQNPAASAKLAFDIIFKTEKDEYAERRLQALLTPENIQSGLFLEQALEEAQDRIHELGCDHDGKLQIQNISIQVLKEVKELAKANFVLVDIMEIAITSPLLKNGLVLVDSPGDGDRNQTRKAIANKLRREADIEVIVKPYARLHTTDEVHRCITQSRKAHGDGKTMVVVAQLDTIRLSEDEVEEIIATQEYGQCADVRQRRAEVVRDIDAGVIDPDDGATSSALDAYYGYLFSSAETSCKRAEFEEKAAKDLLKEYGNTIKVFGVSATEYQISLNPYRKKDSAWSPWMTGVPALIHSLLDMPAEQNYLRCQTHLFRTLPNLSDKLHHVIYQYKDNSDFTVVREQFASRIEEFKQALRAQLATILVGVVPMIYGSTQEYELLQRTRQAVENFSKRPYQTYNMLLKERGIAPENRTTSLSGQNVNWNRDLLETIEPAEGDGLVTKWVSQVQINTTKATTSIENTIAFHLGRGWKVIHKSSCDPKLKQTIGNEWRKLGELVCDAVRQLLLNNNHTSRQVHRTITTEEDVRCFIVSQERLVYSKAQMQPAGRGRLARLRQDVMSRFTYPDHHRQTFIDRYQERAADLIKTSLQQNFDAFEQDALAYLKDFDNVLHQLVANPAYDSREAVKMKKEISRAKANFDNQLVSLQRLWPERRGQTDMALVPMAKKSKTTHRELPWYRRLADNYAFFPKKKEPDLSD